MVEVKGTTDRMLTIGQLAERAGVATSAIRFYEHHGLLRSERTESGHRRYRPDALRRISFVKVAQRVGLTLAEIRDTLDALPRSRTPTATDWAELAAGWRPVLDERIRLLTELRQKLDGCIGCGCLSLDSCAIWNVDDVAASFGSGPRWLEGDRSPAAD
ncbi:MAG: redox-sensitive transcriptional activator SoxR [Actinomycetota bacterium]